MPACEKCWRDSGGDHERYLELIEERYETPCTAEEHAGPDATWCEYCKRFTVHQYAEVCVICDSKPTERKR